MVVTVINIHCNQSSMELIHVQLNIIKYPEPGIYMITSETVIDLSNEFIKYKSSDLTETHLTHAINLPPTHFLP